jgi:TFIIF-interacting CTD phosphatase-like protein
MSRHYEIIIFTAATKCYAEQIRKILDPTDTIISHLLDRQFCFNPNKVSSSENKLPYIKDLRKLNRDLSDTVLLDNSLYCFWYQISNGIPILSYNK